MAELRYGNNMEGVPSTPRETWALAVLSKRVELHLRPLQRISHGNCYGAVKEQLRGVWNVHIQHK